MPFSHKDWKDDPDSSTPLSAAALEDLEDRVTGYTDTALASGLAGKANTSHTHTVAQLGTGTPASGKYLDGAGAWTTLPAGGSGLPSGGAQGDVLVRGASAGTGAWVTPATPTPGDIGAATAAALAALADRVAALEGGSPSAPANTVAPAITTDGTPQTGESVSVSNGTWTGSPTSYTRQWKRNGTNISGATSASYTLQVADEGATVKCTVTATNGTGSTSADSGTITPAAASGGSAFVSAAFTGSAGTALTAYTAAAGSPFTLHPFYTGITSPVITDANRLRSNDSSEGWWLSAATPPSADYTIGIDLSDVGSSNAYAGVFARASATLKTGYEARFSGDSKKFDLIKWVDNVYTMLASNVTASGARLELVVNGTTITMKLDGASIASVTDTALTTAGKVGLSMFHASTNTDGLHVDNLTAQ